MVLDEGMKAQISSAPDYVRSKFDAQIIAVRIMKLFE